MKSTETWLIANWKMNGTAARVRDFAFAINHTAQDLPAHIHAVLCPPAVYIAKAQESLPQNARLKLGAQNCHAARSGAHTGEISVDMVSELGAGYVILGHSERRAAGETDDMVATKAEAVLTAGLMPVLCIGESEAEYSAGKTNAVLEKQLTLFKKLSSRKFLIAYEPIWAIGTGKTPTLLEIAAAHSHIKSVLGSETSVLYGGSVNAGNAKEILALEGVSGALIGGASLEVASMRTIIAAAVGK